MWAVIPPERMSFVFPGSRGTRTLFSGWDRRNTPIGRQRLTRMEEPHLLTHTHFQIPTMAFSTAC